MRAPIALALAAILLALGLALRAPATLVDGRLDELTGGRVRLAGASGTLWNGSGELTFLPAGVRLYLAWHLDPLPLLWGELRGTLGEQGAAPAAFDVERDRYELRNLALRLPAEGLLLALNAPAAVAGARGSVEVHAERLARQGDTIDGRIQAHWLGASLPDPRSGVPIALGDVQIELAGSGTELGGTIVNSGGNVDIAGSVGLAASGGVHIDLRVRPSGTLDADRAAAISTALSTIGTSDGSGAYRVVLTYAP